MPAVYGTVLLHVEAAIRFDTGLADPKSSFLQGSVAVRLHDMEGHPIGYCGRRLDPEVISRRGKWRFPTCLPKGQLLYNAHRALAARDRGIVLVECPWAVMRCAQAEISGVVALPGTTITPKPNSPGWHGRPPCSFSWTLTRLDEKL